MTATLQYKTLEDFGLSKLAGLIHNSTRETSYDSTRELEKKVERAAEEQLQGLVALSEDGKACGFVLYNGDKTACVITDAFTFEHFIGKGFFKTIFNHMKEEGFAKPTVEVDENAKDMKKFFENDINRVWQ